MRLEPKWTTETLLQNQSEDADIACFIKLRQQFNTKPKWELVSHLGQAVKALWAQWERISDEGGLLKRKWESDDGNRIKYQLILPKKLREDAIIAHHDHVTASHRGITKTT